MATVIEPDRVESDHRARHRAEHPHTPATRKRPRRAYRPDEIAEFLNYCDRLTGDIAGVPRARYWRSFLLLSWLTGLTTASLLRIEFRDIDASRRQLRIRGEHRPPLRLSNEMLAAIGAIVEPKRKALFPWTGSREEFAHECGDVIDGALPDE